MVHPLPLLTPPLHPLPAEEAAPAAVAHEPYQDQTYKHQSDNNLLLVSHRAYISGA